MYNSILSFSVLTLLSALDLSLPPPRRKAMMINRGEKRILRRDFGVTSICPLSSSASESERG